MPSLFIYFNCIIYYPCVCLCVCECMWKNLSLLITRVVGLHVFSVGTFTYWAVLLASLPLFLGWLRAEDYFPKPSAAVLRFRNWLAKAALALHSDPSLWLLAYHLFFTCNRSMESASWSRPRKKETKGLYSSPLWRMEWHFGQLWLPVMVSVCW